MQRGPGSYRDTGAFSFLRASAKIRLPRLALVGAFAFLEARCFLFLACEVKRT